MRDVRRELAAVLRNGYDVLHLETAWSGWTALDADPAKVVVNLLYLYAIDDANSSFVDIRTGLQRALRKRAERNLLRRFGTIAAITPRLESAARKITGGKVPVYWFPFAIDSTLYRFVPAQERPTRPIVSLVGSMNWRPSHSAAVRLLTRLWPGIKAQVPEAKLRIVGWRARSMLREYVDLPDVEIIEDVPDIAPYFRDSSVLVHAADDASGIKVKIVEAMAFGVPVVTNTEGIEGTAGSRRRASGGERRRSRTYRTDGGAVAQCSRAGAHARGGAGVDRDAMLAGARARCGRRLLPGYNRPTRGEHGIVTLASPRSDSITHSAFAP